MNNNEQIDLLLLHRKYSELSSVLGQTPNLGGTDKYYNYLGYIARKLQDVHHSSLLSPDSYSAILNEIKEGFEYNPSNRHLMDIEALKYHLLNFVEIDDSSILEQLIFEFELSYESFDVHLNYISTFPQLHRKCSHLETIYKLIQSPKQKSSFKFSFYDQLLAWQKQFVATTKLVLENLEYSTLRKPLKELFRLSTIQLITLSEKQPISAYCQNLRRILDNDLSKVFMDSSIRLAILYSLAKMVLPFLEHPQPPVDCTAILQLICPSLVSLPKFTRFIELYEFLIFLILQQVEIKKDHEFGKKLNDKVQKQQLDMPFIDQLWYYCSVNFTQLSIKLNQSIKKLISHNIYSLINIYCMRLEKYALQNKVLEELLITPFEDDTLRIKMCVLLYQQEEYIKLLQLVQQILASDQIKEHIFRPVIISMSALFTGIFLGKNEEALCFARLNFHENLNSVITPDILLSQIGYCYCHLARQSKYLSEKEHFTAKALEYLHKSLELNQENYLVHFNLSKLMGNDGNLEQALQHIDQACKLNPSEIHCKVMRALIFQALRDNSAALKIVSTLIISQPNRPLLYLIKAAILAEIFLINLSTDPEYIASQKIQKGLKEFIFKKYQKSKEMTQITQNLKKALLGIAKQVYEFDQNDQITSELPYLKTMQNFEVDPLTYVNYRNCIFNSIDVLIHVSLFETASQLLLLIDDGNATNKTEKLYYEALLLEKQGNIDQAIQQYETVLKFDFYHVRTMSKLGLLYLKYQQQDKIQRASELLIAASKFERTSDNCLGLAKLNQIQGNIDESNKQYLTALKIIKCSPIISFQLVMEQYFFTTPQY